MARYIDANMLQDQMYHEAFEKDSDMQKWDSGCWIRYKMFENVVADIPTADVVERKNGKWTLNKDGNWACPFCEFDPYHDNMKGMNYCPNCGAMLKMPLADCGRRREDNGEVH